MSSLDLAQVSFGLLKNGAKGVAIGEEELFLDVERRNGKWRLRIEDLQENRFLTAWVTLADIEDLRVSRRAKCIRDALKRWRNSSAILETIIMEIQAHENQWENGPECQSNFEHEKWASNIPEEDVEAEVESILNADNQLEALKPHLDNLVPGEDDNKKSIYTLNCGSKFPDVRMKQIILLKGTEGGGKSTIMREMSDPFKVKDVGRFTAHALDYTNLEGYEILRLKEIGVMDKEFQGVSTIKFLSADDKGYSVEVTVRDKETGELTTKQYWIPPISVISTTTRVLLEPQFERRCWIFNVDESKEQTERVLRWKAKLEREKAEVELGIRKYTSYDFSKAVLKSFVSKLEPCKIVVPFPQTLTEILTSHVLRVRGDYDKIMAFIKLYAFLNKKRLFKWRDVYFVTPEVCLEALQMIEKPLVSMISRLEDRTRKLIESMKDLGYTSKGVAIGKTEREKIAVKIGRSEKTVRTYFNQWEIQGYMSSDNKKPKTFSLLYDLDVIEDKISEISAKLKTADSLMDKMRKEAQEWLNSRLEIKNLEDIYYFQSVFKPTTESVTEKNIMPSGKTISNLQLSKNLADLPQQNLENRQIEKLPATPKEEKESTQNHEKLLLSEENFEKVIAAIRKLENRQVYAPLPLIEYSTKIQLEDLKRILAVLEREGRVFQYRPNCWKLTK